MRLFSSGVISRGVLSVATSSSDVSNGARRRLAPRLRSGCGATAAVASRSAMGGGGGGGGSGIDIWSAIVGSSTGGALDAVVIVNDVMVFQEVDMSGLCKNLILRTPRLFFRARKKTISDDSTFRDLRFVSAFSFYKSALSTLFYSPP